MQDTGERQIPKNPGTLDGLDINHTERYKWASAYTYDKHVYDIACGTGYGCLLLKASEYSGFDNSAEAIEYAKKNYSLNGSTKFLVANACAMPPMPGADIIVSFETIEHLKEPESFLRWCASHCQTLLISTPIKGSFGRSPFHLFEYRLHEFEAALNKYFSEVMLLVQKFPGGIIYPCRPEDLGVAIAVCQGGRQT